MPFFGGKEVTEPTDKLELVRKRAIHLAPDCSVDEVKVLLDLKKFIEQEVKKVKGEVNEAIADWISHNGEVVHGGKRYYRGVRTETKRTAELVEVADAVLQATGGDLNEFAASLSTSAFKPGHLRKILGDKFKELFHTEKKPRLVLADPRKSDKGNVRYDVEPEMIEVLDK